MTRLGIGSWLPQDEYVHAIALPRTVPGFSPTHPRRVSLRRIPVQVIVGVKNIQYANNQGGQSAQITAGQIGDLPKLHDEEIVGSKKVKMSSSLLKCRIPDNAEKQTKTNARRMGQRQRTCQVLLETLAAISLDSIESERYGCAESSSSA